MARLSSAGGFGGSRGGTIGYMPPEQLDIETGTVDERADVFALACVIYEGLCGSAPFMAATPADSLDRIIGGATYPSELISHFPLGSRERAHERALPHAAGPPPTASRHFATSSLPVWAACARAVAAWSKWLASFRMTSRSSTVSSRRTTRTTPSRSTPHSAGRARAGAMRATTPCALSRR